ncbi:hypothetical protein EB796_012107 [Bugula neritina]|uniref:Uncharacterized protein n=1 Tax=Bugula neritina TaxID=10212 RepID=A0A7J7JW21_BUGNE|nr:hypothetical protein EB796_012107 [Bugula neritina]
MNELVLITNTLLYEPGDIVTGHVWLNICTPTSGRSLYITLQGVETCRRHAEGENTEVFTTELVADGNHLLWEAHYLFFLRNSLPSLIDGKGKQKDLYC